MKRFKNILFVVDPELEGGDAFERAVTLAENNQAQLTVVAILEELPKWTGEEIQGMSLPELQDAIKDKLQLQLETMVSSMGKKFQINIKILTGVVFLAIIHEVMSQKIDLVIKTAEDEGFMDKFFASSDMHLLRKCPCPVWLIKPSRQGQYQKIMAAVDFDPFKDKPEDYVINKQILKMSIDLALSDFSELHIIHIWHAYGESSMRSGLMYQPEAYVDGYVERIRSKHEAYLNKLVAEIIDLEALDYLKLKVHLVKGVAKDMIPEIVKEQKIDLILMGTVGRTGIPGLIMGNTAETVLNRIDCSVLALKPEGFVTPVKLEK